MHCVSCGNPLADGEGFCSKCGAPRATAPAAAEAPPVFCTSCGAKNVAGANNCTSCGAPIGGQATAAVADLGRAVGRSAAQLQEAIQSDEMRANPWASAVIGALAAAAIGTIVMLLVRGALVQYLTATLAAQLQASGGGSEAQMLGPVIASLMKSLIPSGPAMLLTAQGASFATGLSGSAQGTTFNLSVVGRSGISLLWLVPAIALALGGYVSVKYSRATSFLEAATRGALIAVPYTVICAAIALFSKKSATNAITIPGIPFIGSISANVTVRAGVTFFSAVLTALAMAVVFASIGAVVTARGKAAMREASAAFDTLAIPFQEQIPLALRAVGLNLVLGAVTSFVGVLWLAAKFGSSNQPAGLVGGLFGSWFGALPMYAGLASLMQNGAILHLAGEIPGQTVPGLYTSYWSLIGRLYGLPLLLLAASMAILVQAGRTSARKAGATDQRAAILAGAKVAVPYSALMMLLAYLATSNMQVTVSAFVVNLDGRFFAGFGLFGATLTVILFSLVGGGGGGYLHFRRLGAAAATPVAVGPRQAPAMTICVECGQENPAGAAFCDGCGRPLAYEVREVQGGGQ